MSCGVKPTKLKSDLDQHIRIKQTIEPVVCKYCGSKLKNTYALKEHLKNCKLCALKSGRETNLHSCPNCTKTFMTKHKLTSHLKKVHNPNRRYKFQGDETGAKCYFCEYVVKRKRFYSLYEHMSKLHLNELPLTCDVTDCKYRTAVMGQWLAHMRTNHKEEWKSKEEELKSTTYKCRICSREFRTRIKLWEHEKSHERARKTYQCQECEKSFFTKENLQEHLIYRHGHEGTTHPCPFKFCKSHPFASKNRLNLHLNVTHILETAACKDCGKEFKNQPALREHLRRNKTRARAAGRTLSQPCTYPGCSVSFSKTLELKRHIAYAHMTKQKYKCRQCESTFVGIKDRELHMLKDHGGIPCNTCRKLFESWKSFRRHNERLHLHPKEEKEYKCWRHKVLPCYFCKEKFSGNFSLEKHIISAHTNEQIWTCGVNDCRFGTSKSRLEMHMRDKHLSNA